VKVFLASPDESGMAEMTIEGSAHAEVEDVARALNLPVEVGTIRRHTPTTVGYVVTEGRAPSPGAIASRGRVKRTSPPKAAVVDKDVIESKPVSRKKPRARTAGRRKQ
jgi:hypothetical protein